MFDYFPRYMGYRVCARLAPVNFLCPKVNDPFFTTLMSNESVIDLPVECTSECYSARLRRCARKVVQISAGELVVDHGDSNALEQQLENIFKIAKHFKAVLLLDEADAFMEQRTSYHDTHNRLVTVFLRKLEYYQGILFLTTTRMIQFDEAIMNRTHLTIKCDGLTREFRREIWKNLLSKAQTIQGPAIVGDDELQRLDNFSLNGREVRVHGSTSQCTR